MRRADGIRGQHHAFDHAMRIGFQHGAIHERAGIAFVAVADDEFLAAGHLGHGRPLESRRVTATTASPQAADVHLAQHFGRRHLGQRGDQRPIAVGRNVLLDLLGIDDARILQHDLLLAGEERHVGRAPQSLDGWPAQAVDQSLACRPP